MHRVTVERLERPIQEGDWHDKPYRWRAKGPKDEVQNFPTKFEAEQYARIRRHASTQMEAIKASCSGLVSLLRL